MKKNIVLLKIKILKKGVFIVVKALCLVSLILNLSCTDPVAPEYEYKEDLIYVDAYVSTATGASYVTIKETALLHGILKDLFVKGATVSYKNVNNNLEVFLTEFEEGYYPPNDFSASVGETWELLITFSDGRTYKSKPETIIEPVGFSNLRATYNRELLFSESAEDFLPGHFVSLDLDDPGANKNYYFWKFRSFEKIRICEECGDGRIFRDGRCVDIPSVPKYKKLTYFCETDCWQIRYNKDIRIFSDDFTNGISVQGLPVGDIVYYTRNPILVEIQQYALSASAYKYYKTLKDIVDNNGGFNAPPPAALIGNMFNPEDNQEFVLGRFTAASAFVKSVFIDRSQIEDGPIEQNRFIVIEKCIDLCPSEKDCSVRDCIPVTRVPCEESRFRTSIRPEGWID